MSIDKLLSKAIEKHENLEFEEAGKLYRKILSTKPRHLDANYLLGTLYAECSDYEKAQQHLIKANQINPNAPMVQVNLGNVYRKVGKHHLALKCFSRAKVLMPNLYQAHLGLGSTLLELDEEYDKAAECLQKAAVLAPDVPEIYHQMGILAVKCGNLDIAVELFEKARSMNPDMPDIKQDFDIQLNMGLICLKAGENSKARDFFRQACSIYPNSIKSTYFLKIAEGGTPENDLLLKYAENEFNGYADTFEEDLVKKLQYTLPHKIREVLKQTYSSDFRFESAIDLGCGTGLTGELLRDIVNNLDGIDISERMIDIARSKNCYDHLYCGDLVTTIDKFENFYDLFIATDVLVYIGKLDSLLSTIISHAKPGALFLFSTEILDGKGLLLQNSGRFAHSSQYVHDILKEYRCSVVSEEVIDLRLEAGAWIKGNLFVVRLC